MKRNFMQKAMAIILSATLVLMVFGGCSSNSPTNPTASADKQSGAPAEKSKVVFWYLWGGDTAKRLDKIIQEYNAQSDKYIVEGLSVPDSQKIIAAISAGNGPDISDDFISNIGKFASAGVMEPLDEYIAKSGFNVNDYVKSAVDSCRMDGKLYALPLNVNFKALYYNKTLLKEAGYNEPPKTMEELYEMAVKTTKVNPDGTLDVCGFPDFPNIYYMEAFQNAAGGNWYTDDGKAMTPDNKGNAFALKLIRDYREKFGVEKVIQFGAGGKYLDPTDPFLMGKQTFRIDGSWIGKDIRETFKSNIDYGVTYVPYPAENPEYARRAGVSGSVFFVTSTAKNKEGAFDFMCYLLGEKGMLDFTVANGDFPSRLSTLEDETFKKGYDVEFYSELAKTGKLVPAPVGPKNGEYITMVEEQTELCMNMKQDIPTTLKNIYEQGSAILK